MGLGDVDASKLARTVGFVALIAVVAIFVATAVPQAVGADHSYVVLSSSMSPTLQAGDVIFVTRVDPDDIEEGDIITFEPPSGHSEASAERVTHRVVEVARRDGEKLFRTKGDANEVPDQELVPASNVIGVVRFSVPLIGYIISFGGSSTGVMLLVVIPATLLIVTEILALIRAAREP